jgi:hypothetical protein
MRQRGDQEDEGVNKGKQEQKQCDTESDLPEPATE